MADGEPAQQHDLTEVSQCQPVAQPAEHHEGDDVARQRRSIENTVATLVELLAAVPTPEPTIAPCRRSGRSVTATEPQPTQSIAINSRSAAILGKPPPRCQLLARGGTELSKLCMCWWIKLPSSTCEPRLASCQAIGALHTPMAAAESPPDPTNSTFAKLAHQA